MLTGWDLRGNGGQCIARTRRILRQSFSNLRDGAKPDMYEFQNRPPEYLQVLNSFMPYLHENPEISFNPVLSLVFNFT